MSSNKARGTKAETAVVDFLRTNGFPQAERRALNGAKDRGDIAGVVGTVIEVKNAARQELAAWVDEAEMERDEDGAAWGAVWHKRRGHGNPGRWFVTLEGSTFTALLRAALGINEETDREHT